jgi:hypothetical protein
VDNKRALVVFQGRKTMGRATGRQPVGAPLGQQIVEIEFSSLILAQSLVNVLSTIAP